MKRLTCFVVAAIVLAGLALSAPAGENLLKDPSFESIKEANQFGHVWTDWLGWVYEPPGKFLSGNVARTGQRSYEIIGDQGGKVRLQSPEVVVQPGRYKLSCFIRGLSIGKGAYSSSLDFSAGIEGKFFSLKYAKDDKGVAAPVKGTFGWTPVTYVFEVAKETKARLFVGLVAPGWLWIDDASLEKVDDSVALTPEPVVGKEEAPVAPKEKVGAGAIHCPECAYLINKDAANCYACGHVMPSAAKGDTPMVKVLADFEDGKGDLFGKPKITEENAPQGKKALLLDKDFAAIDKPQDWSGYEYIRFDVFNPQEDPVSVTVEITDTASRGYWGRVNYVTVAPPGKSTISLPSNIYVGEKSRPGRPLDPAKITRFVIGAKVKPIVIDNLRLEKLDTSGVKFDGLLALDFGAINTPVMEGYQQATCAMGYEPGRGFGWDAKAELWKTFDCMQPDALYQDFIGVRGGGFRVDVPNGKYHVIVNIDSAGGYWGEVQTFKDRAITANGKPVVQETMDSEVFKKKYFRYAHQEDLPGLDTFAQYVQPMFGVKEFDVDVTDGKIELVFKGASFDISLSALVVYPLDKAEQGKKFWDWTTQRRKAQFEEYFKQITPKATGAKAPAEGYALFSRPFMKPVNASDGPLEGEAIGEKGLSLTVAQGEEAPIVFSLQPGSDVGKIDVECSDLKYAGAMQDRPVPPVKGAITPGWFDFRVTRVTMEGSVYTVSPRYWHPAPAPAAAKVTRTFWLRSKMPANTFAGPYAGTITVKPEKGAARTIPVTVNLLPFALDEISDVAVGPWGCDIGMPWIGADPATGQWSQQMFAKSLDAIKAAGCSSFSARPHVKFTAANGAITLDTDRADKEMELIRAKGFKQMISSYGAGISGYKMYGDANGADEAAAKAGGFASAEEFLKALYKAIDAHAVEKNWLPVAWNLCDEPLGPSIPGSVKNAEAHRKAMEGLKLTTFMGATSMFGDDPKNEHYPLVKALPIPSLNNHDEGSLKVVKEAGNKFSFYNGGTRWTYGQYMKSLVLKHGLVLRLSWHWNIAAGDPYYALDCREDDFCWFNTDETQAMVPAFGFLSQIQPGLNDYRYLSTLQRLVAEKGDKAADAKALLAKLTDLKAGTDRPGPKDIADYDKTRQQVVEAIEGLLKK